MQTGNSFQKLQKLSKAPVRKESLIAWRVTRLLHVGVRVQTARLALCAALALEQNVADFERKLPDFAKFCRAGGVPVAVAQQASDADQPRKRIRESCYEEEDAEERAVYEGLQELGEMTRELLALSLGKK